MTMRKIELKENGGLPSHILWTLAIVAGVAVANIYYNQPLLNMIRQDLGVSEFKANLIAMITQVGYALGLLFIVPLGDLYQRKHIILTNFCVLVVSLLTIALSSNIYLTWVASLLTGVCSMIPQIFVPIASQFSRPEHKGRNVGMVVSGLLIGILASRVVSGFVGEVLGWREMYVIAAVMMVVCAGVVLKVLPHTVGLQRQVYGADDVAVQAGEGLSCPAHLCSPLGHSLRLISERMGVPGVQDGGSTVLCRK